MHPLVVCCFLISLGLGTIITFSSSHWLLAWMGLEINTLAILPLMVGSHHPRGVEAAVKYFLVQATAAALILFGSLSSAWLTGEWMIVHLFAPAPAILVILALALKVGLAPMHFWLPEVIQGLDLVTGWILSTWQKLAPFVLIVQISPSIDPYIFTGLGLSSVVVGGWGGLNQTQLRKILAYSSIAHLGWMIIVVQFASDLTLLALLIYIVMTSTAFLSLKAYECVTINTLSTSWVKVPFVAVMMVVVLLSLGGLPPLTGFLPKWLIINEIVEQGLSVVATVTALSALLSLYYYLRLCYAVALTSAPNTSANTVPWRLCPQLFSWVMPLSVVVAVGALPLGAMVLAIVN
nr:NADH dehydrogenase subunit 2 [Argyropelecus aculeatus]